MDTENNDPIKRHSTNSTGSELVSVPQELVVKDRNRHRNSLASKNGAKTPWILFAVIFLILALVLGAYFGYRNGIARRLEKKKLLLCGLLLNNIS